MMEVSMVLDVEKSKNRFTTLNDAITIRQGDGLSYTLDISIRDQGEYFNLVGYDVRLYATKPSGDVVMDGSNVTILDAGIGHIAYLIPTELVSEQGRITNCYFRITEQESENSEYSITTESFTLEVIKGVTLSLLDGDYIPELDDLLNELEACRNKFDDAEWTRQENEESRENAEAARVASEDNRDDAEAQRRAAEELRAENETERIANENERIANESLREAKFAEYEVRAKGWARYVCVEGEYDPVSRVPTLETPNGGTLYYVPLTEEEQDEGNRYEEWTYTEIGWEKLGKADMFYSAIGASEIDRVLAYEQVEGQAALTLSGLTYLWSGIDIAFTAKFAPTDHIHTLSEMQGSIPSSRIDFTDDISSLALAFMRIGYVYTSFDPTSPAELFGGTWEQLIGVFLRADENTETGGSDLLTLATANLPPHSHTFTGTAASHTHTFTGTKAAHNHTFTGTAASHTHTFTGTAANHNHSFTGTAASHSHYARGGSSASKFVVLQNLGGTSPSILESKSWASSATTTGNYWSPFTDTDCDWGSHVNTESTSITPAGTIANTSVKPAGTNSSTSITPAGSIGNCDITPTGANASTSITPKGTISSVGSGTPFDNRPAYQNVYQWKRVA